MSTDPAAARWSRREGAGELDGSRVLIVLSDLELGGAERQALLLAKYLAHEQGAHVEVFGLLRTGRVAGLCEQVKIPCRLVQISWPRGKLQKVRNLARLAWALRRERPDVVLPYTTFANVLCGLTWRWTGAALCVWNQRDGGVTRMGRRAESWALRQTPRYISNSEQGAGFLVGELGVERGRIRVIRNGVELARPQSDRPTWRSRLGLDGEQFAACMVANLSKHKDHATLLNAWRIVVQRASRSGPAPVLLLAGRFDNTHESLKALAYDLELGRRVRFLGAVDDVAGLLGAVDLGVFSSRCEGCPNGVLECMAAGLAVAGTDIPGIREAVGPAGYPHLAPPGDAEALAIRILELATNPELRGRLGAENRRRIEAEFNPRRMCADTTELILKALPEGFRASREPRGAILPSHS